MDTPHRHHGPKANPSAAVMRMYRPAVDRIDAPCEKIRSVESLRPCDSACLRAEPSRRR